MKYFVLLVGGVFALGSLPAQAQPAEAEKLFQAMQEKITSAKAIQVNVAMTGKTRDFDENTTIKLAIWVMGASQVRCELQVSSKDNKSTSLLAVCDGTAVVMRAESKTVVLPVPPNLAAAVKGGLVTPSADMVLGVLLSDPMALEKRLVNSAFKLGATEKIGLREAQVVHYVANANSGKPENAVKIAVWIDTQTMLPLKRVCIAENGTRGEELYRDWQLDPKIDSKVFELPK